ncbi:hypothetical protein PI124_g12877 [Phytophthora idaei]|nr:hypothetical protein PI125_g12369 [Phytophthora idaei]KAG3150618.1 hypothetical protein PI126_g11416 [Phytophthora idaei]KAG3242284.1 hypothetical protein PI124_g12877 [Phytophthora idaei]
MATFALLSTKVLPEKCATSGSDDDVGEESALLIFVLKKLFQLELIEYVDQLIDLPSFSSRSHVLKPTRLQHS